MNNEKEMNKFTFPNTVLIDTVSFCNLRCSMCAHKDMKRKKGIMEWSLFKKIIDEIAKVDKNTRVWMAFFGESLVLKRTKPSIFEMILYAKSAGLKNVFLNSNGCLLDKESSEKLIASGLDEIYIGIDAFSEETYNKTRVGGIYTQVVHNVLDLIDVKKKKGAKNFKIHVQFVEMEENAKERDAFINYWISKGVDVKIRQKLSWAGLVDNASNNDLGNRHMCYWMMNSMSITDAGDVAICAADPEARFIAGDIGKQSIKKIWNGNLKNLREFHEKEEWDKLPYPCNECNDWKISYADRLILVKKTDRIKVKIKEHFSKLRNLLIPRK